MNILGFGTGMASMTEGTHNDIGGSTSTSYKADSVLEAIRLIGRHDTPMAWIDLTPTERFLWFTATHKASISNNRDGVMLQVVDTNGQGWVRLYVKYDYLQVQFFTGTQWLVCPATTPVYIYTDALRRFDVEFQKDAVRLYVDGLVCAEHKGAVTKPTNPLARIELYECMDYANYSYYWSKVFAATEDTRGIEMVQHSITGDGLHHTDLGGNYDLINDLASYGTQGAISTDLVEQSQSYIASDVAAQYQSGYKIEAMGVSVRAGLNTDGVVTGLAPIIADGTNTVEGATSTLDPVFKPHKAIFTTAPDGGEWTPTKVNACEFGVRTK